MGQNTSSPQRRRRKALPLSGLIARDIGIQILSGRYQPGELLHGELEASLRLQVSRTTYREAMRILAAKGMLEMRQHVGTRVTPKERWHWLDADLLAWTCQFDRGQSIGGIAELRRAVEPGVAALAAEKRTAAQLVDLGRALTTLQAHSGAQPLTDAQREFRRCLFVSSQNVYLEALGRATDGAVGASPPTPASVQHYSSVFEAVSMRNARAAREAMTVLIDSASAVRGKLTWPIFSSSGQASSHAAAASRRR